MVRSPSPTLQETVTVTVEPGLSPWVSVETVSDWQVIPAEASAALAVDWALAAACDGVRARVAARAAWCATSLMRSFVSASRPHSTTNNSSRISSGVRRVSSAAAEPRSLWRSMLARSRTERAGPRSIDGAVMAWPQRRSMSELPISSGP